MKIAYTVITADYFAHALALGDSLTKYNPDYMYVIGLVDRRDHFPEITFSSKYPVIEVAELQSPHFQGMNERYYLYELVWALKPFFGEYIVQKYQPEIMLYFDSDILIFHNFSSLEAQLKQNSIVLTPHVCSLVEEEKAIVQPNDVDFIKAGVFNAGFFGLKLPSLNSEKFLTWWKERLVYYGSSTISTGFYGDQKWLNLVFILFEEVHILKSPGYNVAHFNLHERRLTNRNGILYVNGQFPLIFYHYSGHDWKNPSVISKHNTKYVLEEREDLKEVLALYRHLLFENNVSLYSAFTCFYSQPNEERITWERKSEQEKNAIERIKSLEAELKTKTDNKRKKKTVFKGAF